MRENKQNVSPNPTLQGASWNWTRGSQEPRISRFKTVDREWRKKIMGLSQKEKEIDERLSGMLRSQVTKESLPTTLSEEKGEDKGRDEKMVNSFASEGNLTLQKYVQQNGQISPQQLETRRELVQIAGMLRGLVAGRFERSDKLGERELLQLIKSGMRALGGKGSEGK